MPEQQSNTITEVTRRGIMDYLSVGRHWSGVLREDEFLGRLYDLKRMPSKDYRLAYNTAEKDIRQHRVNNLDWSDDWIFTDSRFDLLFGPDEDLLKFLAETVHPNARPITQEATEMVKEYNSLLTIDGWELFQSREISRKPVFAYRQIGDNICPQLDEAQRIATRLSGNYVARQVRRLQEAVTNDPELAIGTAKEFLETLCKTILFERDVMFSKNEDFPTLVKLTIKSIDVVPAGISNSSQSEKTITVLVNSLAQIGNQLAEMRNQFGTGHGRPNHHVGLHQCHARLAVGTAATLAVFLYECHEARKR